MGFGGGQEQRRPGRHADQGGEQCEALDGLRGGYAGGEHHGLNLLLVPADRLRGNSHGFISHGLHVGRAGCFFGTGLDATERATDECG